MSKKEDESTKSFIGRDPYSDINFVKRKAQIKDKEGNIIFDEDVEFPDYFDENSINIVSNKYLCNEAKMKETSLRQMIDRVSDVITDWGVKDKYLKDKEDAERFRYYLKYYQANQYFAFNSPVYFNVGLREKPQCSACFILEVNDDMESIFDLTKLESMIFKWGSGSGVNMSTLRSSKEQVRGGGNASGPVSFLKSHDVVAGVIKSGGVLRRSAKLACLDVSHPDIDKFIHCKEKEEKKLQILMDAGVEPDEGQDMSDHVFFQNTNISVRLNDEFMNAVDEDHDYWTRFVTTGEKCEKFRARDLLRDVSELAWKTADPGVQFSDTMNKWNTCKNSGPIMSTNPCGEFAFLDNSSCNLASINLLKFFTKNEDDEMEFDFYGFQNLVDTIIMAQDIVVDNSFYPSRKITNMTHNFRPLGLGYSNLGALLMYLGVAYDSAEGRHIAGLITSIMTGIAYYRSHKVASELGSFSKFEENKNTMYDVLDGHKIELDKLLEKIKSSIYKHKELIDKLSNLSFITWKRISDITEEDGGFRNAQISLLAPTGTTSFAMGCATTGIEPDYSLVKYKMLSGNNGSTMKMVNPIVHDALENLGYTKQEIDRIMEELRIRGHLEECVVLKEEHLEVFDTANIPEGGSRCIPYMGHVSMMAAVQPFLSGAISKTINMPEHITVEDIYDLYLNAWKKGLKGITIYRDNSKMFQPLSTKTGTQSVGLSNLASQLRGRKRLPDERQAITHKFDVGGTEGYIVSGL
ncbi:MAG: vitamin B12-dependent ribonucleotide reductase, partial [Candidatus Peribacteraceae bacterium]|nr:vitamin B12-dependent ribonucleotide reductase [Candidatus Peribacteraceae bacterium]